MNKQNKKIKRFFLNSTNILIGIRFIARVLTIIIAVFLVASFFLTNPVQKSSLNPFGQSLPECTMMLSFYAAVLGLIIAWWIEGFGGFLTIGALLLFSIIHYSAGGTILWNIWILGIPAALYIFCWWSTNVSDRYDIYRE